MNGKLDGISTLLKKAWGIFTSPENFRVYALVGLLPPALIILLQYLANSYGEVVFRPILNQVGIFPIIVGGLLLLIVGLVLWAWYDVTLLMVHASFIAGQPQSITAYINGAKKKTLHYLLTSFLRNAIVIVGYVLLIIPGILFSIWYHYTPTIAAVESREVDAFNTSKALMKRFFWPLFGRQLVLALLYGLPQAVLQIIHPLAGSLWYLTTPFFSLANILLYFNAKQMMTTSPLAPEVAPKPV